MYVGKSTGIVPLFIYILIIFCIYLLLHHRHGGNWHFDSSVYHVHLSGININVDFGFESLVKHLGLKAGNLNQQKPNSVGDLSRIQPLELCSVLRLSQTHLGSVAAGCSAQTFSLTL